MKGRVRKTEKKKHKKIKVIKKKRKKDLDCSNILQRWQESDVH